MHKPLFVMILISAACQPPENPDTWEPVAFEPATVPYRESADEPVITGTRHQAAAERPDDGDHTSPWRRNQGALGSRPVNTSPVLCRDLDVLVMMTEGTAVPGQPLALVLVASIADSAIELAPGDELHALVQVPAGSSLRPVTATASRLEPGEIVALALVESVAGPWMTEDVLPAWDVVAQLPALTGPMYATVRPSISPGPAPSYQSLCD